MIDIVEQQVEGGDPLNDAAFYLPPFIGRQHPRDRVEGQDAVDRAALRVEREGDAVIIKRLRGGGGAPLEIGERQMVEPLAQGGCCRATQHLAIEPLRIVAVEHEASHQSLLKPGAPWRISAVLMHGPGQCACCRCFGG